MQIFRSVGLQAYTNAWSDILSPHSFKWLYIYYLTSEGLQRRFLTTADVEFAGDVFDPTSPFRFLRAVDRHVWKIVVDVRLEKLRQRPLVLADRIERLKHISAVEKIIAKTAASNRRRRLLARLAQHRTLRRQEAAATAQGRRRRNFACRRLTVSTAAVDIVQESFEIGKTEFD